MYARNYFKERWFIVIFLWKTVWRSFLWKETSPFFFFIHFKNLQELRIVKWKREYSSLQALVFFNYFEYMKIIYVNYGFKEMNIQVIFAVMDALKQWWK